MSFPKTCALWVAVSCLGGCAYSIHPVATEDVLVDQPDLSGTWQTNQLEKGTKVRLDHVVLKKAGKEHPGLYRMEIVRERGVQSSVWHAQLLKLGDVVYLEISPTNAELGPMEAEYNLPLHKVFRVAASKDELRVDICYDPELLTAVKKERLGLFRSGQDRWVITASSGELQDLYRQYGGKFFDEKRTIRWRKQD